MSLLKTKLLVSGCGITFSNQEAKTWVNILKSIGVNIVDVSGPAVSNQWILNRAILQLQRDPTIKKAVIQLTSLGKLDVEIDEERFNVLVAPDSKRNFTVNKIWPSSASVEHESKALWRKWLHSPGLEKQDIKVKLLLLKNYCETNNIDCVVVQGYDMLWSAVDKQELGSIISDIDGNIIDDYKMSACYDAEKEVPVLEYQFHLAEVFCNTLTSEFADRLQKIKSQYLSLESTNKTP